MHFPPLQRLAAFLMFWLLGGVLPALATPATVRLAVGEYPPFKIEAEPGGGALTEIVVESFKARNIVAHVEWVPNNRAIAGVMAGAVDGSFGWAHSPERDEVLLYSSKPIYIYRMVFVQRAGERFQWSTLADLGPYTIGVTRGNFYSQPFADLQEQGVLKVDEASDDVNNLQKLLRMRIDLFPLEASVARYMITAKLEPSQWNRLTVQHKAFWTVPIYFVVPKKIPNAQEIMDAFDAGYRELQRSKRVEALEKKLRR